LIRNFVTTGGAEKYCVEVTKILAKNHDVHVFAQKFDDEQCGNITKHKVPLTLEKPRYVNQFLFSSYCKKHTIGKFDIVHSHERMSDFDVCTIHCPCFVTHDPKKKFKYWFKSFTSIRSMAYRWMEKKQYLYNKNKKVFIAVSKFVEKNILNYYDIPVNRFALAYPGVTTNKEQYGNTDLHQQYNIPKDKLILLFVGSEFKRKGLKYAIEAMSMSESYHLIVAGGGNKEPFEQLAKKLNVANRVTFLGLVKNTNELYKGSDVFILPTLMDPCAMSPLEAMLHNLPVIVSGNRHAGFSEHVKNNECFVLEDPTDVNCIQKHLKELESKEVRDNYSQKAIHLAQKVTWETTAESTFNTYIQILDEKK